MAWQPTIPQAGDLLTNSQADIQGNFAELETYIHPSTPTINMTPLAAVPAVPVANAWQLFTGPSPYGGSAQLSLQDNPGNIYPITQIELTDPIYGAGVLNRPKKNGWCFLPNGLLLCWMSQTAAGAVTWAFGAPHLTNFPGFSLVYTAWSGGFGAAGAAGNNTYVSHMTNASVTVQMNLAAVPLTYVTVWAIGE